MHMVIGSIVFLSKERLMQSKKNAKEALIYSPDRDGVVEPSLNWDNGEGWPTTRNGSADELF